MDYSTFHDAIKALSDPSVGKAKPMENVECAGFASTGTQRSRPSGKEIGGTEGDEAFSPLQVRAHAPLTA
jgi:hypothetical protein